MYIDDFIWLPEYEDKLSFKHAVSRDETEEIFFNRPRFRFVESGNRPNEDVFSVSGQIYAGRYLIVFFIRKTANTALIISGRDMNPTERRYYERKR